MRCPGRLALVALLAAASLVSPAGASAAPTHDAQAAASVRLPPPDAGWDYQIGGPRPVPARARVVVRDRKAAPAGDYAVCYVNAFQTQPDEQRFWQRPAHRALVLRDRSGRPVTDSAWGEWLLDTRTAATRRALVRVVGRWVRGCARHGYDAVELDNLDSWTRSSGVLTRRGNVAYARQLARTAHRAGLAVAQKNTAALLRQRRRIGFDFAVVEECGRWHECRAFTREYGGRALLVEYRLRDWRAACRSVGHRTAVILRDRAVSPTGPYRAC